MLPLPLLKTISVKSKKNVISRITRKTFLREKMLMSKFCKEKLINDFFGRLNVLVQNPHKVYYTNQCHNFLSIKNLSNVGKKDTNALKMYPFAKRTY